MGFPNQLVPLETKTKKLQPFMPAPLERIQYRPTQGVKSHFLEQKANAHKIKKILEFLHL